MRSIFFILAVVTVLGLAKTSSSSLLSPNFYDYSCPAALPAIRRVVEDAVQKERRMGALLLRLHFHDCFVNVIYYSVYSLAFIKTRVIISSNFFTYIILLVKLSFNLFVYDLYVGL